MNGLSSSFDNLPRDPLEREPVAWVLNLDAEHELEAPRGWQPTDRLRSIVRAQRERLRGALVGPRDVVLEEDDLVNGLRRAAGLRGLAWLPTPRALKILAAAGAVCTPTPPLEVLQRVNRRDWAARLRAPLAQDSFEKHVVLDIDSALARLALPSGRGWLVRRGFGAAGRGRRRIRSGRPDAGEMAWLVASLRLGPLVVEPWMELVREHTRSGLVRPDGSLLLSAPCFQTTTEEGAWTGTRRAEAGELPRADDDRLAHMLETVGRALADEGYRGPYGIDAWSCRIDGRVVLNPLSEVNARFTMDWADALVHDARDGSARRLLDQLDAPPVRRA